MLSRRRTSRTAWEPASIEAVGCRVVVAAELVQIAERIAGREGAATDASPLGESVSPRSKRGNGVDASLCSLRAAKTPSSDRGRVAMRGGGDPAAA